MTCKHYLGRVLGVERSKLECLGKRDGYFEVSVFFEPVLFSELSFELLNCFASELFLASELNLSF